MPADVLPGPCPHRPATDSWRVRGGKPVAWCDDCGGYVVADEAWLPVIKDPSPKFRSLVTGIEAPHQTVVVDDELTYDWRGDRPLAVGDVVRLPENGRSYVDKHRGPWDGTVTALSSDYDGPLREVLSLVRRG